ILLTTEAAEYTCLRPAATYKAVFEPLQQQAAIFAQIIQGLSPQLGGDAKASLDEVAARLARAKVGKAYAGPREALAMNGAFVIGQLELWDGTKGTKLTASPFAESLRQEVEAVGAWRAQDPGAGITIRDPGSNPPAPAATGPGSAEGDAGMQADLDMARRLQAQLDVQQARGPQGRRGAGQGAPYIKISEEEIADDYPMPAQYSKVEEEMDELLLMEDDAFNLDPDSLPRRLLTDFAIYNSEGFCASLELLPMWSGLEPDVTLFASGRVLDDDGEWAGGQAVNAGAAAGSAEAGASGAGSSGGGEAGMVMYLSQIQEWIVEFSCDMLFISIRTDVAWYRLSGPTQQYAPWFNVVLKCARLATHLLGALTNEARASRLSFADIVKRCTGSPEDSTVFISRKGEAVERFIVVHGQVILNQFRNYPVKAVRESSFVAALRARMQQRRHSKLYMASKSKLRVGGSNRNPMRDRAAARAKPMTATATTMVKGIWASYFPSSSAEEADKAAAAAEPAAQEVNEDEEEEEGDGDFSGAAEVEQALADAAIAGQAAKARKQAHPKSAVTWPEGPSSEGQSNNKLYRKVKVADVTAQLGDVVELAVKGSAEDDDSSPPPLGLLQALRQTPSGAKEALVRVVVQGCETVLGDAAAEHELFVTADILCRPAHAIVGKWNAVHLQRPWQVSSRLSHFEDDQARGERNRAAKAAGAELEWIYRSQYLPQEGMFRHLPADLQLGTWLPLSKEGASENDSQDFISPTSFALKGHTYVAGDFLFLHSQATEQLPGAADQRANVPQYAAKEGRYHKGGSNTGLRAHAVGQLVAVKASKGKLSGKQGISGIEVRRFYRPEDISQDRAYAAGYREVYASDEVFSLDLDQVLGPCTVVAPGMPSGKADFVCTATFNASTMAFSDPPASLQTAGPGAEEAAKGKGKGKAADAKGKGKAAAPADDKGKGKGKAGEGPGPASDGSAAPCRNVAPHNDGVALKTLDIFAGCGGLSEGMHEAKAADAHWAIEYEAPAAEAFRLNHPHAAVWTANCNVILAAAMRKAGMSSSCQASEEALAEVDRLDEATMQALPWPGQVEFLCGGPPCQGYSGMNRFNKGNWSMVQNSMVMAYLSFADFYRPRYFLLENVRNFVSHNKTFTFRLTLRSLLDMGYQVRFGVLNAGNFGVSQSRKRTFIWGVAPGDPLPSWPKPLHVFRSPQLTISLPGNVQYAAVRQDVGAPLRTVTVRDAIGDLPPIINGACAEEMPYTGPPVSAFQKAIRSGARALGDHICKEMNPLNLERCRCIPKGVPGADWRVLQQIVAQDPSREKYQGQALVPWCLPNTADRHNGWRGLFGRLDWQGHFPTSVTDPQPMGKVGQVFHPEQDRIVSVRECARAQGFPDDFRFYGNVHNKHRQIGNAVPPPLAAALGRQLRAALEAKAAQQSQALLDAQLAALARS
ncbi:hypothetical protein WJX73_005011, partial [Symbiochloris irregularis]